MLYVLKIDIHPSKHYLHMKGQIKNPTTNVFYLNENFTLLNAASKGAIIPWHFDREQPHPAFDTVSRPLIFENVVDDIEFEYDGYIPQIIADINQIDENIIELASYSGWYPKPQNSDSFDFELEVHLPLGYEIASNGNVLDYSHIVSSTKQGDIVLFASNILKRCEYSKENINCTFLCPEDMIGKMEQRAENLMKANELFTKIYGALSDTTEMTEIVSVFRPRGGWGYKRGNATFFSAEWGINEIYHPVDFHELAHGWWNIANVTTNDWINEGGAEFSSYIAAKTIYGLSYANQYILDCNESIKAVTEKISIVDTNYESPDRNTNHYLKPTIMFILAQNKFGEQEIFSLLKDFFQTYKGTCNATTENFLKLCSSDMKEFFEPFLFVNNWNHLQNKNFK